MLSVGNSTEAYNCMIKNSSLAVYGHGNSASTAASVVGIAMLFLTVAYMWWVRYSHIPLSLFHPLLLNVSLSSFNLSGHRQIRKLRGQKPNEDDDEVRSAQRKSF